MRSAKGQTARAKSTAPSQDRRQAGSAFQSVCTSSRSQQCVHPRRHGTCWPLLDTDAILQFSAGNGGAYSGNGGGWGAQIDNPVSFIVDAGGYQMPFFVGANGNDVDYSVPPIALGGSNGNFGAVRPLQPGPGDSLTYL